MVLWFALYIFGVWFACDLCFCADISEVRRSSFAQIDFARDWEIHCTELSSASSVGALAALFVAKAGEGSPCILPQSRFVAFRARGFAGEELIIYSPRKLPKRPRKHYTLQAFAPPFLLSFSL